MTTQSGKIHSSNYPDMYDNHDDCAWLIEVDRNHVVQLSFEVGRPFTFELQGDSGGLGVGLG